MDSTSTSMTPKWSKDVEARASKVALDAHMNHDHTREFLAAVSELADGAPEMLMFEAGQICCYCFITSLRTQNY